MKYTLTLIMAFLIMACNEPKSNTETGPAIISGQIKNTLDSVLELSDMDNNTIKSIKLDSMGVFKDSINVKESLSLYLKLLNGWIKLYLEPGMNLKISADTNQFYQSIKFEGKGAIYNNYFAANFLLDDRIYDTRVNINMNDLTEVKQYYNIREHSLLALLESYKFNNRSKFYIKEKNDIRFNNYTYLLNKVVRLKHFNDTLVVPEDFLDFITHIDLESEEVLKYPDFLSSLYSFDYLILSDSLGITQKSPFDANKFMDIINTRFKSKKAKSIILNIKLKNYVAQRRAMKILEPLFNQYFKIETDTQKLVEIKKLYSTLNLLSPGNKAPEFTATDILGKKVSLSDFKGKYVYIDIWATWCVPCLKEFPFLEELEHNLKDENIVFIGVSFDRNSKAWAKMVLEKNMVGIQLLEKKGFKSEIANSYLIKSVPRFILIDADGNIVNYKASRPSGGAKEEIEKAIML